MIVAQSTEAVSYTHLDVYKRQVGGNACMPSGNTMLPGVWSLHPLKPYILCPNNSNDGDDDDYDDYYYYKVIKKFIEENV